MNIKDGEMTIFKSRNYEDNYFTTTVKKNKETGELVTNTDGKIIRLYKRVYLPEGITVENSAKVRFKGYTAISIKEDGTINEYIVVQEILEYLQNNNQETVQAPQKNEEFEYYGTSDDDLPF